MANSRGGFVWARVDGPGPLYANLYGSLRLAMLEGRLRAGSRLPSSRALASDLGVSRNVVLLAYEHLVAEGYARGRSGSGTYIVDELPDNALAVGRPAARALAASAPARLSRYGQGLMAAPAFRPVSYARRPVPIRYDFAYARSPLDLLPEATWRRLHTRRLRAADNSWQRPVPPEGYEPLRAALAEHLIRVRAINCTAAQIVIVNGSQQALDLIGRILLDPGDTVVIENPHYIDARRAFQTLGARLRPVAVDNEGLIIDRLPKTRTRLAYVTPSHQFPTGAVMPLHRRVALLEWARRVGSYLIEDDFDSEYRYEGRPVEALQSLDQFGLVIYTGTFSTVLYPALRIGYAVIPASLLPAFREAKWLHDRHAPVLQQQVLADFIGEGMYERYLRRIRARNAERRQELLRSLAHWCGDEIEVRGAGAGMHVLGWLRNVSVERVPDLVEAAAAAGVGIYTVSENYLGPPPAAGICIGYAAIDRPQIDAGIRLLAEILRRFNRRGQAGGFGNGPLTPSPSVRKVRAETATG